jgi:hypothetical protein
MKLRFVWLICIFFFANTSFAGDQNKDSLKRHSLGFVFSPLAVASWSYPGYYVIPDEQEGRLQSRNHPISLWPMGLSYGYRMFSFLKIEAGINYSIEKTKLRQADYYENGIHRIKTIDYRQDFIQIPVFIVLFPYSKKKLKELSAPFYFKIGASFDFVAGDYTTSTAYNYTDHHFSPVPGYNYNIVNESAGSNKNKIRFNRISPLFSFGQIINMKKKFSFYYSVATFQFKAFYQKRNTVEYFKNTRYALLSLGVNYNF